MPAAIPLAGAVVGAIGARSSRPDAPATPDYAGLAQQEGAESRESALQTARLGSPNEITPWGSITRQYDPSSEQFTYTTTLSPDQQRLFEGNQETDLARMELGQTQIGNISDLWSQPFSTEGMTDRVTSVDRGNIQSSVPTMDYQINPGAVPDYQAVLDLEGLGDRPNLDFSGLPAMPGVGDFGAERSRVEDALYQQQSSRLEPEWQEREQRLRNQLYAQGIREGNPAWDQAIDGFNRQRNTAFEEARLSSITGAGQEQSRLFGMASSARGQSAQEALASAGFALDARSQGVAEELAQGNFANAVVQLERNYGLDRQSATNMATQLQNSMELSAGTFANTANQQDFDQQMQQAMLANSSRGAEIDEAAYLRSLPFNEFSAITQGTQPTQPNFSGPTVAPGISGAPIYNAGQDAYASAYNNYAQEMNQLNELWSTLGNVGGQAAGAWMERRRDNNATN